MVRGAGGAGRMVGTTEAAAGGAGEAAEGEMPERSRLAGFVLGALLFGIGTGAGMFVALLGGDVIFANLDVVLAVLVAAFAVVGALGVVLFLFRRSLLRLVFGLRDAEIGRVVGPFAAAARHLARGEPDRALEAGQALAQIALARYALVTSRRWIIASLTGLIAALAALAGTTLLFRQNQLIAEQTLLLREQTVKIEQQVALAEAANELTEAERSAQILTLISEIGQDLSLASEEAQKAGKPWPYDLLVDFGPSIGARIVVATLSARPYRYLRAAAPLETLDDAVRLVAPRRRDLPQLSAAFAARPPPATGALIERALSPERGIILDMLYRNRVFDMTPLGSLGADFSHADVRTPQLVRATLGFLTLSGASFEDRVIVETGFPGATLYAASFRRAIIRRASFARVRGEAVHALFRPGVAEAVTYLTGADFGDAVLDGNDFTAANLLLARFDGAILDRTRFGEASLDGATFRGSVLVEADFTGASLKSVDFDGAFVFEEGFIERLSREALPGTWTPARFVAEPVEIGEVWKNPVAWAHVGVEIPMERIENRRPFRLRRVAPFE